MTGAKLTDAEFTDFNCAYCGNQISFPTAEIGKLKECPTCLEVMIVPEPGVEAQRIAFPIHTSRLVLRRLQPLDCQDLHALMSHEELLRYLPWTTVTIEEVEAWLEKDKEVRFPQQDRDVYFAIELVERAKMVGVVSFWFENAEFDPGEFLVLMNPEFQRQGLATEASHGLFSYAFGALRVRRMVAHCDTRNAAARGMFLKAGMRQEAEYIKDAFVKEEWVNNFGFALLREEFESSKDGAMAPGAAPIKPV